MRIKAHSNENRANLIDAATVYEYRHASTPQSPRNVRFAASYSHFGSETLLSPKSDR